MLFDPLEEQLDPPSGLVEKRDCQGWEVEIVGQEGESLASFGVYEFD